MQIFDLWILACGLFHFRLISQLAENFVLFGVNTEVQRDETRGERRSFLQVRECLGRKSKLQLKISYQKMKGNVFYWIQS